jgi:hypothetical protein
MTRARFNSSNSAPSDLVVNHICDVKNVLGTLLHPFLLVRGMGCGNYPLTVHYTVLLMLDPELVVCNGYNNRYERIVTGCTYIRMAKQNAK